MFGVLSDNHTGELMQGRITDQSLLPPGLRPVHTMLFMYYFLLETDHLTLQTKDSFFPLCLLQFLVRLNTEFQFSLK